MYYLYRPVFILEVVELLQKHVGHVDVSPLATCAQVRKQKQKFI